jgi:iron(III) transport system ATP-binding protein
VTLKGDTVQVNGDGENLPLAMPAPAELKAAGRATLAIRPSEIDFVGEGGAVRGVVKRCAYLGEIIDYRIDVGGREVRVQKDRTMPGPREGQPCRLVFVRPRWYGRDEW